MSKESLPLSSLLGMLIKRAVFFEFFLELRIPVFLRGDFLFFGLVVIVDLACVWSAISLY